LLFEPRWWCQSLVVLTPKSILHPQLDKSLWLLVFQRTVAVYTNTVIIDCGISAHLLILNWMSYVLALFIGPYWICLILSSTCLFSETSIWSSFVSCILYLHTNFVQRKVTVWCQSGQGSISLVMPYLLLMVLFHCYKITAIQDAVSKVLIIWLLKFLAF